MKYNLIPEDYGGDTIFVNISAKTGQNVDDLLQMILLITISTHHIQKGTMYTMDWEV